MRLKTFSFAGSRWSEESFPALDSQQTLVLAFGSSAFLDNPKPFAELRAAYPRSHLIGCSTAGEIFGAKVSDGTIAVAALAFDSTKVKRASASIRTSADSLRAGADIAQRLAAPDLRSVIVLSDGLNVNGSELVRGLNSQLGPSVIVTGGLAGDGDRFQRTWVLEDGLPRANHVTAIGLYGDQICIGHGSRGGWDQFGPERVVTRSEGNVLYELDGKPALALYKDYLGDRAAGLPATAMLFPLSIRASSTDEKSLVRTVLAVDEARQSMTFAGDIPNGSRAQLMRANIDRLVQGASDAAQMAAADGAGERSAQAPVLTIAISCVGRRLVLGERTEEEIEATTEALPRGAQQVGFYSYGELSPYGRGSCDLHNQTMTLTTLRET